MLVSPDAPLPADADRLQVQARFFKVATNELIGLGPTYEGVNGKPVPVANVRIGFAFHQDPSQALQFGDDPMRLPTKVGDYLYDMTDPAVQEQVRLFEAAFVQWDVLFDLTFRRTEFDVPPFLSPESPRSALRFLRLPFRF